MHKTTLVVDDFVIEQASEILGTKGIKQTVDAALHQVLVRYAKEHFMEVSLRCIDFEFARRMEELEQQELQCLPPLSDT